MSPALESRHMEGSPQIQSKEGSRKVAFQGIQTKPGPDGAPPGANLLSGPIWAEVGRALRLTRRELQVAQGMFDNLTEGALAAELGISEHTVHGHANRLFKKARVTTRAQLVLRVVHQGLRLCKLEQAI
jgi:DNA-binding NarL/FixJ family response regulator